VVLVYSSAEQVNSQVHSVKLLNLCSILFRCLSSMLLLEVCRNGCFISSHFYVALPITIVLIAVLILVDFPNKIAVPSRENFTSHDS